MKKKELVIGTRGSALAVIQAQMVKDTIEYNFPGYEVTLKKIKTKGDMLLDSPLHKIGDKGLFVKEIDNELINGTIDLAVHSLKDVPTELPPSIIIGGVLKRGEVRDVLVAREKKKFNELPAGARVATSSLRRSVQLAIYRHDVTIVDIRGNIDTRIKKMENSYCDAVVLAGAGMIRAGYEEKISEYFDPGMIIPAACQGIVGITVKKESQNILEILDTLSCKNTMIAAASEREFLHTLQGGCKVPVGCVTHITDDHFFIQGFLSTIDGSTRILKEIRGSKEKSIDIARECAEQILGNGGHEILTEIRKGSGYET